MLSTLPFAIPQFQFATASGTPSVAEGVINLSSTALSNLQLRNFEAYSLSLFLGINLAPTTLKAYPMIDNSVFAETDMTWTSDQPSFTDLAKTTPYTAHMWRGAFPFPEALDLTSHNLSVTFAANLPTGGTISTDLFFSTGALTGRYHNPGVRSPAV